MKGDPQLVVGGTIHYFLQLPFFTPEDAQWLLETGMAHKDEDNIGFPCHSAKPYKDSYTCSTHSSSWYPS
jgi:hypothetical protein